MRRTLAVGLAAALLAAGSGLIGAGAASAQDKKTIALIPGLTTDAFYITMR
jgi:ribose transport system substrate-binding protein